MLVLLVLLVLLVVLVVLVLVVLVLLTAAATTAAATLLSSSSSRGPRTVSTIDAMLSLVLKILATFPAVQVGSVAPSEANLTKRGRLLSEMVHQGSTLVHFEHRCS